YFNHAQHVEVGGVECQTCHGPIEEMEVVKQHTNLTMGWCIDCHRTTDVNTQGNAYYDELVELHSKKHNVPMKVEDVGGLEGAKCHYKKLIIPFFVYMDNNNKKLYWKGIEQLANDPEFVKYANKEFPEYLPVNGDKTDNGGNSRRDFLKLMGFSVAAASLAA